MFDSATNSAILLALLPIAAVIGISLNLFIRARGGRSFNLRLKGFGIDLTIETSPQQSHVNKEVEEKDEL